MPCFDEWNFVKVQKKYTQNLTRCIIFNSNMTRCVFLKSKLDALFFLNSKSDAFFFPIQSLSPKENFNSKSCFLKKHEKCQVCRFHGVKWTKTWFFWMQTFFKIWHVEKFLIQNLTRCIFFNPKSDALW